MSSTIAFTLDLEDHRPDRSVEPRYGLITERLLDDLDAWGVRGTVFVVGELIDEAPDLIRSIGARGHEIGLHGADHRPLPEVGAQRFRDATAKATEALAALTGSPVAGFRAPIFSLVQDTAWAPEILTELGYVYSSSVLPARNPLFGWPGAPTEPFCWPCGLVELPCPVAGIGPVRLPLLGGAYLRISPRAIVGWALHRTRSHRARWCYVHPYDFDLDETKWVVPQLGRLGSRLMWWGRRRMRPRVRDLVAGSNLTLATIAAEYADAAIFSPLETSS